MTTDIEMTITNDMQPTPTPDTVITKPTGIGARLKAAREAMHLSEKEAAARLHLNPKFIILMEAEDFGNDLPATFVRGYIRSYGRLLNLPMNELDAAIEQLGIHIPATTTLAIPTLHTPLTQNNERYIQWLTYIIILVMAALVGIWWNSHPQNTKSVHKPTPATATPAPTTAVTTSVMPNTTPLTMPISAQPPVNSTTKAVPQIALPQAAPVVEKKTEVTAPAPSEETEMDIPEPGLNTSDY